MTELWNPVVGYELYYEVSNLGRVKRLDRPRAHKKKGLSLVIKGKILKQHPSTNKYLGVNLCKGGICRFTKIHKIVYAAFIGGVEVGKMIDHIDRNKSNNSLTNLRAVTKSQNNRNSGKRGVTSSRYKGVSFRAKNSKWSAKICFDGKCLYLGCFTLETEAARAYNKAVETYFGEYGFQNILEEP